MAKDAASGTLPLPLARCARSWSVRMTEVLERWMATRKWIQLYAALKGPLFQHARCYRASVRLDWPVMLALFCTIYGFSVYNAHMAQRRNLRCVSIFGQLGTCTWRQAHWDLPWDVWI